MIGEKNFNSFFINSNELIKPVTIVYARSSLSCNKLKPNSTYMKAATYMHICFFFIRLRTRSLTEHDLLCESNFSNSWEHLTCWPDSTCPVQLHARKDRAFYTCLREAQLAGLATFLIINY